MHKTTVNPLMGTLKPLINRPLYSNTVTGTLAVDGWAVTFGTSSRGLRRVAARPGPSSLYHGGGWAVTFANVTAHRSTASVPVPTSYYVIWPCNCQCPLKG